MDKLEESGFVCHIRNIFTGALSYVEDITSLSPCLRVINEMLDICSLYSVFFYITFNDKKSVYTIWRTETSIRNNKIKQ